MFKASEFGTSLSENLKELFREAPRGAAQSGVLDLPNVWSSQTQFRRLQALSVSFHVLVLALLVIPFLPQLNPLQGVLTRPAPVTRIQYIPNSAPQMDGIRDPWSGGGASGERNPIPASKGAIPVFSAIQVTPPSVKPPQDPKMLTPPTLLGSPELQLQSPKMPNWGDPLSNTITDSSGLGSGSGIGSGRGTGVGPGSGGGFGPGDGGGAGNNHFHVGGNGDGFPSCIYCPNPQFTSEGVKAKLQGSVILVATITAEGRAVDIRVVQSLGLGLDEEAVKAVRSWRFRPAIGPDNKPAAVAAPIEVTFRLY